MDPENTAMTCTTFYNSSLLSTPNIVKAWTDNNTTQSTGGCWPSGTVTITNVTSTTIYVTAADATGCDNGTVGWNGTITLSTDADSNVPSIGAYYGKLDSQN